MTADFIINIFLILSFLFFGLICFLHIEKKSFLNKIVFFIHLLIVIILCSLIYTYKLYNDSNNLTIISLLLMIIFFTLYLILSVISYTFIRLRIIFFPFFLILLSFYLISTFFYSSNNTEMELFNNKMLIIHILTSLFSYSMLTICSITSLSVFVQEKILKSQTYNKYISSLLPSIYEGEILTIRFLSLTFLFLIISLSTGYFYNLEQYGNAKYFFNEKSLLSLFSTVIIFTLLFLRSFYGLNSKTTLKIILLCYLFINFSYFGIKLIN